MTIKTKIANATNYQTANRTKSNIGYIVIHYTGNNGDTAAGNATYFAREPNLKASAHYFVDETEVWQSVADKDGAWHVGTKSYRHPVCRNSNSIGVEICMQDSNGNVRQGSIDNAVQLTRALMAKYGITASRVLRHYDVTGKDCPAPMVSNAGLWAAFKTAIMEDNDMTAEQVRQIVREEIAAEAAKQATAAPEGWASSAWEKAQETGIMDGTRPQAPVQRQELAVVLQREGLLGK